MVGFKSGGVKGASPGVVLSKRECSTEEPSPSLGGLLLCRAAPFLGERVIEPPAVWPDGTVLLLSAPPHAKTLYEGWRPREDSYSSARRSATPSGLLTKPKSSQGNWPRHLRSKACAFIGIAREGRLRGRGAPLGSRRGASRGWGNPIEEGRRPVDRPGSLFALPSPGTWEPQDIICLNGPRNGPA